ncbi:MAG: hypothetical protein KatS3mg031_0242 [Chitinophagales bacterium]|nr:MAG: hypothetical protein KatS3mg031_0242 [Chitinophagales bacterium]
MQYAFFLLCLLALMTEASGQFIHRCATHEQFLLNAAKYPVYNAAVEQMYQKALARAKASSVQKAPQTWDTIFRIPVVVHVVYHDSSENIEDSLIYNQIEVLNQDYRRKNPDSANTRSIFKPLAADAGIEFYLATRDPQGNPTTGINRIYTQREYFSGLGDIFSGSSIGADEVKSDSTGGVNAWDTERYLNIWVCNLEDPANPFALVLGVAYPPDGAPHWPMDTMQPNSNLHGVVIHYKVFGRANPRATGQIFSLADRGRTATHEIGHYLGLRHIWGDGPLSILIPDCSVDDGLDDTPNSGMNSQTAAFTAQGCNINTNTCQDPQNDLPDMWENYMDYSKESCQNLFTHQQVALMREMLKLARPLLPDYVVNGVNIGNPYDTLHTAAFTAMPSKSFLLNIYPNPVANLLYYSIFPNSRSERFFITIVNSLGQHVKQLEGSPGGWVDVADLAPGVYSFSAVAGDATQTKPFIITPGF